MKRRVFYLIAMSSYPHLRQYKRRNRIFLTDKIQGFQNRLNLSPSAPEERWNAGLPIESLIEYQRLFRAGDSTIPARLVLLNEQMDILQKQKEQIEETMDRLSYKISRYEEAVKTGKLVWTKEE